VTPHDLAAQVFSEPMTGAALAQWEARVREEGALGYRESLAPVAEMLALLVELRQARARLAAATPDVRPLA
jgi:hypothetical protein